MSDITNETERLRRATERRRNAQDARTAEKRRKAQIVREMVAAIDEVIGEPHEGPPTVAVIIASAIIAGEIPHTKVVY